MTAQVEFIFDFGSPNAYLAYHAITPILDRHNVELRVTPCLLGGIFKATGNQSPVMAFANIKGKLEYDRLEMSRFVKKHGLSKFARNPHFPVNTLLLMRAALAAEQDGRLTDYIQAGLKHMWEDGLKMDDTEVFAQAMTDSGFDGKDLLERTQDPEIKAGLIANTEAAVERGVFGIPTFFVEGEMYFGKDRLVQIDEQLSN